MFLTLAIIDTIIREELAIIENRILEKNLAAKKKAEKRAKNIAVSAPCNMKAIVIDDDLDGDDDDDDLDGDDDEEDGWEKFFI